MPQQSPGSNFKMNMLQQKNSISNFALIVFIEQNLIQGISTHMDCDFKKYGKERQYCSRRRYFCLKKHINLHQFRQLANLTDELFGKCLQQSLTIMQKQRKNCRNTQQVYLTSSKYSVISFEMRKTLIQMVQQQNISVYQASKILNIKSSTGKAIVRKYRRQGRIFQRKREKAVDYQIIRQNHPTNQDESGRDENQQMIADNKNEENVIQQSASNALEAINMPNTPHYFFVPLLWAQPNHYYLI